MSPVTQQDTVDTGDIARALRRGWWIILGCMLAGVIAALIVLRVATPLWTARASVLVREATPLPSALMSQMGDGAAGAAASLLGGSLRSSVETDIALLRSRELVGEVVDSLGLQVVVKEPRGTPPWRAVAKLEVTGPFRPVTLEIQPNASGMRVTGQDIDTTLARNSPIAFPAGTIHLADSLSLPVTIRVFDREDAVTRAAKRVDVHRSGGDVIGIAWPSEDSLSAPAAANLLVDRFLVRRRGVDRGLNQRRLEFVSSQIDSVDRALDRALVAQRRFHESAETVDPAISAKTYLESLVRLREQRETLVMEEGALAHLRQQLQTKTVQPRALAAYPAFLRSPAMNEIIGKIGTLEAERVSLLQRQRRDDDPAVAAVRASIARLEQELEPLARTYGDAIVQQRTSLDLEIASVNERLAKLPNQVESAFQHTSDVERLAKTSLALNAQRVELRLATIGEGGEARTVDIARPQWKRSFPSKILTLTLGLLAGLALGFALAIVRAFGGARVADPSPRPH